MVGLHELRLTAQLTCIVVSELQGPIIPRNQPQGGARVRHACFTVLRLGETGEYATRRLALTRARRLTCVGPFDHGHGEFVPKSRIIGGQRIGAGQRRAGRVQLTRGTTGLRLVAIQRHLPGKVIRNEGLFLGKKWNGLCISPSRLQPFAGLVDRESMTGIEKGQLHPVLDLHRGVGQGRPLFVELSEFFAVTSRERTEFRARRALLFETLGSQREQLHQACVIAEISIRLSKRIDDRRIGRVALGSQGQQAIALRLVAHALPNPSGFVEPMGGHTWWLCPHTYLLKQRGIRLWVTCPRTMRLIQRNLVVRVGRQALNQGFRLSRIHDFDRHVTRSPQRRTASNDDKFAAPQTFFSFPPRLQRRSKRR